MIHKESAQATKDGETGAHPAGVRAAHLSGLHAGRVFSRQELMERVWNYEGGYVGDESGAWMAVRRLREKLEDDPAQPKYIITRRGRATISKKDL